MIVHDDCTHGLLVSASRLFEKQIVFFEPAALGDPRVNRTKCWFVQPDSEPAPVEVSYPHADQIVYFVGFLSPNAVLTPSHRRA